MRLGRRTFKLIYVAGHLFHDLVCLLSIWTVQTEHFSVLTETDLRTINDLGDLAIYSKHLLPDTLHPLIDGMRSPQDFRSGHPSFLLCQLV